YASSGQVHSGPSSTKPSRWQPSRTLAHGVSLPSHTATTTCAASAGTAPERWNAPAGPAGISTGSRSSCTDSAVRTVAPAHSGSVPSIGAHASIVSTPPATAIFGAPSGHERALAPATTSSPGTDVGAATGDAACGPGVGTEP